MNKKELSIPKFTSQAGDARWYDRHRLQLASAMEHSRKVPLLILRQAVARTKLHPVTIRLATEDIDAARELAAQKGVAIKPLLSCFA